MGLDATGDNELDAAPQAAGWLARALPGAGDMTGPGQARAELTIGVVGPHELVERIMLSGLPAGGETGPSPGLPAGGRLAAARLVAAAYRDEQEAADKVARFGSAIDACVLASRAAYENAQRAGALRCPAAFILLNGSSLYAALLRASRAGHDLARSSVDGLSRAEVEEAFAELGIPARDVQVRDAAPGPAALASFHERLFRQGQTSAAFTSQQAVAGRLSAEGVPAFPLRPTGSAIRAALRTAALLADGEQLQDSQLAVALVEVPALREPLRRGDARYERDELRLSVHRFLTREARRMDAAVSALSDHGFLIVATRGSLRGEAGRGLPITERARAELGARIEVGIGTGSTEQEAEAQARASLGASAAAERAGRRSHPQVPAQRLAPAAVQLRGLETLSRLAEKLADDGTALVVDAETASGLLQVTPRTARRMLRLLVEDGLAWPLPPSRSPQPGRPRQAYRLAVEKLNQH